MNEVHEIFPSWGELVEYMREESRMMDMFLPDNEPGERWVLDNDFYRDKHGKLVDNWVFKIHWDRYYDETEGFPTLELALEAKLFAGESIKDLYERGYDWFAGLEEKRT